MMFVDGFIIKQKRERIKEQLRSQKKRRRFLDKLPHFRDLDEKYMKEIPPNMQFTGSIYELLKAKGAPDNCYLISFDKKLDQQILPLKDALSETVGFGTGTIISCIPGKLGFYEGEDMGVRYILEHGVP